MMENRKLTVVVEKTNTGFSAYIKEVDGIVGVGGTITELKENLNEAFYHHLEYVNEVEGSSLSISDFEIAYTLDLKQLFDYFKVINKSAFAEDYLNINQSLFRRYTSGLAPLSDKRMSEISKGLRKLADELEDLSLVAH